jgi:serine/threonine protein kinase/Leucine-rich repeat (LRR) protein
VIEDKDIRKIWPEYSLEEEIGSGAYGRVLLLSGPQDENEPQYYAVKCVRIQPDRHAAGGPDAGGADYDGAYEQFVEYSLREVKIMKSLSDSEHIVRILEYRICRHPEEYALDLYIRMEYLTSLPEYLTYNDADEASILKMGADICLALEDCERAGILHRDIKPENIFVTESGAYKLGDFGMAGYVTMTENEYVRMGTFQYAAPEVYRREKANGLSDQYSLGIVLYRLLNRNRLPFLGDSTVRMMEEREKAFRYRMEGRELPSPGDASPAASAVILKACSFSPGQRFSSFSEFRRYLNDPEKYIEEQKRKKRIIDRISILLWSLAFCLLLVTAWIFFGKPRTGEGGPVYENAEAGSGSGEAAGEMEADPLTEGPGAAGYEEMTWHDEVLKEALRKECETYMIPFTERNLMKIDYLDLSSLPIRDFQDLSKCRNLMTLNLDQTDFSDISILQDMSEMTSLSINGCPVKDLTGIGTYMPMLESLEVSDTLIRDLSGLEGLTCLKCLYLRGTDVSDLRTLSPDVYSTLERLDISGTDIEESRYIGALKFLTHLDISDTKISSLDFCRYISSLDTCLMRNTSVTDLSPLADASSLAALDLRGNQITDFGPLEGLNLQDLIVSPIHLPDITWLLDSGQLLSLDLSLLQGMDLDEVVRALKGTSVRDLSLAGFQSDSFKVLQELDQLEGLSLSGSNVKDLSWIRGMNIRRLDLSDTDLAAEDMSVLGGAGFDTLDISDTRIEDLSWVGELQYLHSFYLADIPAADLKPLASQLYLAVLDLSGTDAEDYIFLEYLNPDLIGTENVPRSCIDTIFSIGGITCTGRLESCIYAGRYYGYNPWQI